MTFEHKDNVNDQKVATAGSRIIIQEIKDFELSSEEHFGFVLELIRGEKVNLREIRILIDAISANVKAV